jgi:hypothetical protein
LLCRFLIAVSLIALAAGGHSIRGDSVPALPDLVREQGKDLKPLREKIGTYAADGRLSLVDIYRAQCELQAGSGWVLEELFREELTLPGGDRVALPANCLRTAKKGPALWILAGIHGEEPAGPNALAEQLPVLAVMARSGVPMVVMPMLNPLGYQRNWRYPDVAVYSAANPGSSVGDSDHMLPDDQGKARRAEPVCRQAGRLTAKVVALAREYPPALSLDLHEDNLLKEGYLYSQGPAGAADPVAEAIVGLFRSREFPILMDGTTRFGETVRRGVVSGTRDGSIDELISAPAVIIGGGRHKGPAGRSVLVLETSSMDTPLRGRVVVHATILGSLDTLWAIARKLR